MSVKNSLLALLAQKPSTPAELQHRFHEAMNGLWNLNMGQVTQTLGRLERDGLVEAVGTVPTPTGHEAVSYQLTDKGIDEVFDWWETPVERPDTERDELVMKIVLALQRDDIDVINLMDTQRRAVLDQIGNVNKQLRELEALPSAQRLMGERRILDLEADVRFLDRAESLISTLPAPAQNSSSRKDG